MGVLDKYSMERPHLFMIYIGGKTGKSLIELHDIRFVVAYKLEDTYEDLRKNWWGTPESLHLDCWGILQAADGYQINIVPRHEAVESDVSLFFVNLGGYTRETFTELHKNVLIAAKDEKEAKAKALAMVRDWEQGHKDNIYQLDTLVNLNSLISSQWSLQLQRQSSSSDFRFEFGYNPIAQKASFP